MPAAVTYSPTVSIEKTLAHFESLHYIEPAIGNRQSVKSSPTSSHAAGRGVGNFK